MKLTDEAGAEWESVDPSWKPEPKVAAAAAVGTPLAVVLIWLAGHFDLDLTAEVAAAFSALIAAGVGYFKRG